ncbi:hypothetical protein IV203_026164 [Nitzschia inconspicua]|uniref:Transmembrane protein n=1 Tax=Nitzschia inconspicua TaxID=303405 RepID=A0A9K3PZM6_9STRA|nr:hypothetical protein IV203_026164 [Nitzschia inconspicua]
MTIRDSNDSNDRTDSNFLTPVPSAPTEEELRAGSAVAATDPEVIIYAEPVYPGTYNADDVPFVQATSVVPEHSPYAYASSSVYNPHGSGGINSATSGSIAVATGPARPSSSFAVATGPPRPPSSAVTPGVSVVTGPLGTNSRQPVHATTQYNSRYRDSNGALTCCAVSILITVSICVCCFLPFIVFAIAWAAAAENWDEAY